MTAAHRTLPFGSRVQVINQRNGKRVVVRINDRGPFIRGRIIDVTPAAANALGFNGLAPVKLVRN
jgi:rare lipoprotein A